MLFRYATSNLRPDSPAYQYALNRADELLENVSPSDHKAIVLSGDIKRRLNQPEQAVGQYELALVTRPGDHKTQIVLIRLLDSLERYEDAAVRLEDLVDSDFKNAPQYRNLLYEIKEKLRMQREQQQ
jgi:predicted Zn-dependent protease